LADNIKCYEQQIKTAVKIVSLPTFLFSAFSQWKENIPIAIPNLKLPK
jgi:hypothetical protein